MGEEKEEEVKLSNTQTEAEIIELFNSPIINQCWGNEPDILKSIEKEKYKKYIKVSSTFLEELITFISWTQGFANGTGFDDAVKIMTESLFDLKKEPKYEFQITKIIKHLNLNDPILKQ